MYTINKQYYCSTWKCILVLNMNHATCFWSRKWYKASHVEQQFIYHLIPKDPCKKKVSVQDSALNLICFTLPLFPMIKFLERIFAERRFFLIIRYFNFWSEFDETWFIIIIRHIAISNCTLYLTRNMFPMMAFFCLLWISKIFCFWNNSPQSFFC